jgi:hypothetical protein
MTEALVPDAGAELDALLTPELEAIVTEGVQTFLRVGMALRALQERRAYLDQGHDTFEDYCRAKWGFNRAHGYRLINAAETVAALSPIGDTPLPANEAQARALAAAPAEIRSTVWQKAVETAPDGKVTAAHVRALIARDIAPEGVVLQKGPETRKEAAARQEQEAARVPARTLVEVEAQIEASGVVQEEHRQTVLRRCARLWRVVSWIEDVAKARAGGEAPVAMWIELLGAMQTVEDALDRAFLQAAAVKKVEQEQEQAEGKA